VADTKQLFFELEPIPARLEIYTNPPGATLYVRGNRAQNPYNQSVDPGTYEIYAEATDHRPRREVVVLKPGQRMPVDLELEYVQRSGRPELIGFWTAAGAVAGATGVLAALEDPDVLGDNPAPSTLVVRAASRAGSWGRWSPQPSCLRTSATIWRCSASARCRSAPRGGSHRPHGLRAKLDRRGVDGRCIGARRRRGDGCPARLQGTQLRPRRRHPERRRDRRARGRAGGARLQEEGASWPTTSRTGSSRG
jgi:hypothetical protein